MDFLTTAIQAAKSSGGIIEQSFQENTDIIAKDRHDIVSRIDYESEANIIKILRNAYPDHHIVAEESGQNSIKSEYCWYIDPLDGTSNFLAGNPYFSVSIGVAFQNHIICGVVYNPITHELYYAERGHGDFFNEHHISVSTRKNLEDAFVVAGYSASESDIQDGLRVVERLALHTKKVMINFSPALDLCNLARGRIDALVDNGTTPEDHAAGSIILTEVRGIVDTYGQTGWNVQHTGIIASNGVIQDSVVQYA